MSDLTPEVEERARKLADEIKARRNGRAIEEAYLDPSSRHYRPSYVPSKRIREQEDARINGMVIALTFILGRPNDKQLAEQFIEDDPAWRALL